MKKIITMLTAFLVLSIGTVNCYGNFKLTKKLNNGINTLGNKWISEAAFLVSVIIQLYTITVIVDAIVLNSWEFWTGKNLISATDFDKNGKAVKEINDDEATLRITYLKFGKEMTMQGFKDGVPTGEKVFLKKNEPGVIYKQEITGELTKLDPTQYNLQDARYAKAKLKLDQIISVH